MRKMVAVGALTVAMAAGVGGCAALRRAVQVDPVTGESTLVRETKALVDTGVLGPWGQVALMAVTGLQNAFLGVRAVKRSGKKKRAEHAAEVAKQVAAAVAPSPSK